MELFKKHGSKNISLRKTEIMMVGKQRGNYIGCDTEYKQK